ncbi:MAG: ornithine cyclodeaminase family protein [Betaproteobacteria bacterium]
MALFLREEDVKQLLTMPLALDRVTAAFRYLGTGEGIDLPRERIRLPFVSQQLMQAGVPALNVIGYKHYTNSRDATRFLIYIYNAERGHLDAVIEGNMLGMMRTGAASGVATRYLARPDAGVVGIFGTGWQAVGQLRAIALVRTLRQVKVFGRNPERMANFCERMRTELGVPVEPAATPEATVRGSDIVVTITSSSVPLFKAEHLDPGVHINAAGANSLVRRELDEGTLVRASMVVVDSVPAALREAGDLLPLLEKGRLHTRQLIELGAIVAGNAVGRATPTQITVFESQGLAIQDLVVGAALVELARARGLGTELPLAM